MYFEAQGASSAFRDAGPHRTNRAVVHTGFRNVADDPDFRPELANEYLLLWGMFMTSFLADDYLADNNFHGAQQTLVTSASSKTSISLAACLAKRGGHRAVGLTSERNRAFVEGLGLYDQVTTYDEIDQLDSSVASGMVDMAGSGTVRTNVHNHFADNLHLGGAYQDNRIVPYEGLRADTMTKTQQRDLLDLVDAYLVTLPDGPRAARLADVERHLADTHFCWIGGMSEDDAFYYRIQSPVTFIEFDHHTGVFLNNDEPAKFHVHTIVRTPNGNDYGIDLLRLHYENAGDHHHHG